MFKALTVLFCSYYIYRFFVPIDIKKYIPFANKISEDGFKIEDYTEDDLKDELQGVIKVIVLTLSWMLLKVIEFIYLLFAVNYDVYKTPTIVMILWSISSLIKANKNKSKPIDVQRLDKLGYKVKTKIITMLNICYFGYMFYLMFIV